MKRTWILIVLLFTLTMCDRVNLTVDPPAASAASKISGFGGFPTKVSTSIEKYNGMEYLIILGEVDGHGIDVEVVNLTKDKLECDLLKNKLK